jgi:integrase
MAQIRNPRAGLDDRWHKRVKNPDGTTRLVRSDLYDKVTRWRVRWVDDTGSEHTKVLRLKADAQAHLDKVTADVVKGDYVSPRHAAVTFKVVADEWIAGKATKKPKTVAGYKSLLNTLILPRWGDTKLKDITHADFQRWITGLSADGSARFEGEGLSGSRVVQTHQCMSAILKYAIRTNRITKNVATGIELPRRAVSDHRYLTHEQLLQLAEYVRLGQRREGLGTMTLVMGYCGLRFGECVALRARDVKDKRITVRSSVTRVAGSGYVGGATKTSRTRWVPVPEFIWDELEAQAWRERFDPTSAIREIKHLPPDPDQLVFPGRDDGYLTTFDYRRCFDLAAKDIGIPDLVPHELRHTCASLAIASGANVLAVQRLLGHATASMTLDRYGHLFSDDLTAVAEALDTAGRAAAKSTAV